MLDENGLGDYRSETSRPGETKNSDDQMNEENKDISHS